MSMEAHHAHALIEDAQLALDGAHRAALEADGAKLRRGLEGAAALLGQAATAGLDGDMQAAVVNVQADVAKALADLDAGKLIEMEALVEAARTRLAPV